MLARGLTGEFAEQVFNQIRGFGEYGFPESHAASFALLVYVSAWLKCYYPAAFCAAIINSQPMGFYAPSQLIRDARAHGVRVLPVDVNCSGWDCRLEECGMRSAECGVGGRGSTDAFDSALRVPHSAFARPPPRPARADRRPPGGRRKDRSGAAGRPFTSLDDFVRRTGLSQAMVAKLAEADAFSLAGSSIAARRCGRRWARRSESKRSAAAWPALPTTMSRLPNCRRCRRSSRCLPTIARPASR